MWNEDLFGPLSANKKLLNENLLCPWALDFADEYLIVFRLSHYFNYFNVCPEGSKTLMLCVTLYLAKETPRLLIFHIPNIHYRAYLNTLGINDFSHPYTIYRNNCSSWTKCIQHYSKTPLAYLKIIFAFLGRCAYSFLQEVRQSAKLLSRPSK